MKGIAAQSSAASLFAGVMLMSACRGGEEPAPGNDHAGSGQVQLALAEAPDDAACLRVRIEGNRVVVRAVPLTPGVASTHRLTGLPVGLALFSAEAFSVPCGALSDGLAPPWATEQPVMARIEAGQIASVLLRLLRNGRANVSVDFDDGTPPLPPPPAGAACTGGARSSVSSYVLPAAPGVFTKAIFSVGDSANNKPDGTPYRLVGIPDGAGAFDNGDGSFTMLVNHELGNNSGTTRAHGSKGAFVSKWTIRKCDLAVLKGEDLIQRVATWNPATSSYNPPAAGVSFGRFCAAEFAAKGAFFDAATGAGFDGRLYTNGEEIGAEGRAFAHGLDGVSYEIPRLGKYSYENAVPHPGAGAKTIVVGLDDSGGGQVYVYVGTKTSSGSPVERAGLTNGALFGLKVVGHPVEDPAAGIPSGTAFEMHPFGNVENMTGAALESASNAAGVTKYQRPEDGNWDPKSPNHFYFVTTASFTGNSRLWRLRFKDINDPAAGGQIDMLLSGSEGPRMMDNITVDDGGRFVYLQEDPGGHDYLAKIWRYSIAADTLTLVAEHDPARFTGPARLTNDEESSGIFDASSILGPGWFLMTDQAHKGHADPELVEFGQLQALFDPAAR